MLPSLTTIHQRKGAFYIYNTLGEKKKLMKKVYFFI